MKQLIKILPLFFFGFINAQEGIVQSVYFKFDKFDVDDKQTAEMVDFINKRDSSRIASVQIFGYTDDVGKDEYNYKLSSNRANTIKNKLVDNGIKNKIIVTIEGKGRILIEDDMNTNLPEARSKNRRVDVVINLKPKAKRSIPGMFLGVKKTHVVGDKIYLENVLFDTGSSKLTMKSKQELDIVARALLRNKTLEIEIQGHICCTPPYQKEAYDMDTMKRELSSNRAEAVFDYLIKKKISEDRMDFKGYGNTVPLGLGPEYDRRVELLVTKI
jgi:outer membrane protein OmpA-like peptidoglycan-associated protein